MRLKLSKDKFTNPYVWFLVLYCIFAFVFYLPFLIYHKSFLWGSDGLSQMYPGLIYFKKWLSDIFTSIFINHSFEVEMWNLSLGFGQDVFGNAIDFRIPNFLFALFPEEQIELFLGLYVNVSMVLAGEAFIKFAFKKSNSTIGTIVGALIYVFSGYTLYFSAKHTFFLEMMILFPFLLTGIDTIFEKKLSYLFIFTVFLSALSYFYFLYMITIPAVIYALFKFFEQKKHGMIEFIKIIGIFLWQYLLGVLMSAISLIPALVKVFQSNRTSSAGGNKILLWEKEYYLDFVKGIFTTNYIPNLGCIAIAGLGIIAFVYLVFSRNKWKNKILLQTVIYVITLLLPPLSLLFCAYTGRAQRWSFVLTFWIAMSFAIMYPKMLDRNSKLYKKVLVVCDILSCLYVITVFVTKDQVDANILWIFIYLAILAVNNFTSFFEGHRQEMIILFLACMIVETGMKSLSLYSPWADNYISEFVEASKIIDRGEDNASFMVRSLGDDSVYRSDIVTYPPGGGEKYNQNNYGLRNGVNGLASYYSFTNGQISQYSIDMGNSQQNVRFLILDWDQRTALNALAAVKYLASTDISNNRIPYGYELISTGKKVFSDKHEENSYLYKNQYALPMMYVYDSYINQASYSKLEVNEKEQAMLQGIVLEEDIDYPETDLEFNYDVLLDWNEITGYIKSNQLDTGNFEIEEDGVTVKGYTCLSMPIPKTAGEIYVRIKDIEFISKNVNEEQGWKPADVSWMSASMGDVSDTCTLTNSTYEYYMGKRDFLLNLGGSNEEGLVNISFGLNGEYQFSDIEILCQPMGKYASQIARLTETPVTDIMVDTNAITGNVNVTEEKIVCVAIPYSEGWNATVNGKETQIFPANGMYMAIRVLPGENKIYFQYHTQGLLTGTIVTCIAFNLFMILIFTRKIIAAKQQVEG